MRFATQECAFEKEVSTTWTGHDNFVADRFPVLPGSWLLGSQQAGRAFGGVHQRGGAEVALDRRVASSDVLAVEALADISGDEAQALIDRLGGDRAATEQAARLKAKRKS